jgi:isopentenyl diphosphate isomerase/L-lactate dehydrogenase-like FMN-dependent dehydrogenase
MFDRETSRRHFIRYLAASPLLAHWGLSGCSPQGSSGPGSAAGAGGGDPALEARIAAVLDSPESAINLFDFEAMAEAVLPPAHWGYLVTGVDGDETRLANRTGFDRFQLRPRRLVDVSSVDMSVNLLGQDWPTPIVLSPVGSQRAWHEDGELAAARGSSARNHHQILSTVSTVSIEDVNAVRDVPAWYQLYPTSSWEVAQVLVSRAEDAGCDTLVLTVDLGVGSNRETLERLILTDTRDCTECHEAEAPSDDPMNFPTGWLERKPMFDGLDMSRVNFDTPFMDWEWVARLRSITDLRIVIKGIMRDDDAARCVAEGMDGIIVSNHGGRAEPSGRSTIEALPEVVDAVRGRIPVLVDGGIRRGSDILKAMAIGADAVCIGRPYIWGMACFGQAGVETVLGILTEELRVAMQLHGVASLGDLDRSFVTRG